MHLRFTLSCCILVATASQCSADFIILTLTDAGAGRTLFTFAGSSAVAANGNFGSSEQFTVSGLFVGSPGDILDDTLESNTSLIANLSGGSETFGSIRLFTQNGSDQIRLGLVSQLSTKENDVLEASGQFVADIDFRLFAPGEFVVETNDTGTWKFNVAAVPEPSSALVVTAFLPIALFRRTRKQLFQVEKGY